MTVTHYRTVNVDGLDVFYREAGSNAAPTLLLLHGFPTSGHMFRGLIPLLAEHFHLVAPDLPGFGRTTRRPRDMFAYSFEKLAEVINRFTEVIGLDRFAEVQLDLMLDYASNVALYPEFQAYFRKHQPPLLAIWGKNDPFFLPPGAEAYGRDLPKAHIRFLDTGHFALETHAAEIAQAIRGFLRP